MESNSDAWEGRQLVTPSSRRKPPGHANEDELPDHDTKQSQSLSSTVASKASAPQFGASGLHAGSPFTFASALTPPQPTTPSSVSKLDSSESSVAGKLISSPDFLSTEIPNWGSQTARQAFSSSSLVRTSHPSTPESSLLALSSSNGLLSPAHHRSSSLQSLTPSEISFIAAGEDQGSYDVTKEPLPEERFFDANFQAAIKDGMEIAEKAVNALQKDDWISKDQADLKRIWSDAKKLSKYQGTDTRTIAVLGDSGEGKSSLINSLLHCPDIAKEADLGTACTSVITEYHQKLVHHTAPITIEVDRLSQPEIEDQIRELLWSYRQLYLPNLEAEADAAEYKRCQHESEVALSTLQSAFGDHEELEGLLEAAKLDESDAISAQLTEWAHALDWPDTTAIAQDADQCSETTEQFMEDRFWPFTKTIRVYLDAQILRNGIILSDLPGLHDVNLARVRITERYIFKCDHILLVAKISRAITDQSLKSSLYTVLRRHVPHEWESNGAKSLNVTIVCTRSDDINTKTARKAFCGPRKPIDVATMRQLDDQIQNANDRKIKKKLQLEQDFLLIKARNEDVTKKLQSAYAAKVEGGSLSVFCVSNRHYKKFSEKGNTEYVIASGIPALRHFCHSIAAKAQHREARHFLDTSLPSLLSSMQLWVESFRERSESSWQELQEKLETGAEAAISQITRVPTTLEQEFTELVTDQLLRIAEHRNDYFESASIKKSEEWFAWHWASYSAWCRNNGTYTTPARGHVRWNSELIWKMRSELDYQWDIVEEEVPPSFEKMTNLIKAALMDYKSVVDGIGGFPTFAEGIESRVRDVEYLSSRLERELSNFIKNIRRDASEDNASSYILRLMVPSYRSAASQSGTGTAARQRKIVHGRITSGVLFPTIAGYIKAGLEAAIRGTFQTVGSSALKIITDRIQADLETTIAQRREKGTPLDDFREKLEVEMWELKREFEELHTRIGPLRNDREESDPEVEDETEAHSEDSETETAEADEAV